MNEYNEFLESKEVSPPGVVSERVLSEVHRGLNPTIPSVAAKVLGIHAVLSVVTLSICSQFGIQVFPVMDLMDSFMLVAGHSYCMVFCGALYVGASAFAMSFLLTPEEVLAIRRNRLLQFLILSSVSLAAFVFFGAEILLIPALMWLAGALLAWVTSVELGWSIRTGVLGRSA